MKINILHPPPVELAGDRRRHGIIFIALLVVAALGLLLGTYAIVADTAYYDALETAALAVFVGAALLLSYFGEKLQGYKQLTPAQLRELADLGEQHSEIKDYCDLIARIGRPPIRAEYEACCSWAESKTKPN